MKKLIMLCSAIGMTLLGSCNQKPDVNVLLENQEIKKEIFNSIAENHEYMMGFMESTQNNERAMQMMQGNEKMLGNMMKDSAMMNNMMGNSNMMHSMMKQIMTDSTKMNSMMRMMQQKGMMSEECMQSCMKMMNHKGMMDGKE